MYVLRAASRFNLYGKSRRDQTSINSLIIKKLPYAGAVLIWWRRPDRPRADAC